MTKTSSLKDLKMCIALRVEDPDYVLVLNHLNILGRIKAILWALHRYNYWSYLLSWGWLKLICQFIISGKEATND